MFVKIYSLEIQSVILVFSTQLCELLPPSLLSGLTSSPSPPLPCLKKYTVYIYTVWGGGMGFWASDR
jgi:hypothetical protein